MLTHNSNQGMQIKPRGEYHYTPTNQAKLHKVMITSVGEDVEQQELSYVAGGSLTWHNCFGKQSDFTYYRNAYPRTQQFQF